MSDMRRKFSMKKLEGLSQRALAKELRAMPEDQRELVIALLLLKYGAAVLGYLNYKPIGVAA